MFEVAAVMAPDVQGAGGEVARQLAVELQAEQFAASVDQASASVQVPPEVFAVQRAEVPVHDLGETIFSAWVDVNQRYETIFSFAAEPGGIAGAAPIVNEAPADRIGVGASGEAARSSTAGLEAMLEHSLDVSLWSVQVNLLTSGVKRSTEGVQTLFRNSG